MSAPTIVRVLEGLAVTASGKHLARLAELGAGYRLLVHAAQPLIAGCPACEWDGHDDCSKPAHTCGQGGAR